MGWSGITTKLLAKKKGKHIKRLTFIVNVGRNGTETSQSLENEDAIGLLFTLTQQKTSGYIVILLRGPCQMILQQMSIP